MFKELNVFPFTKDLLQRLVNGNRSFQATFKSIRQAGGCMGDILQEQVIDCKAEAEAFDASSSSKPLDHMLTAKEVIEGKAEAET